jgi:four helix bundle protein
LLIGRIVDLVILETWAAMDSRTAELLARVKRFIVRIVKLARGLPRSPECLVLTQQLVRAGAGTAGNYRAACRARSGREFIARLGVAVEEADESVLWLEVIVEAEIRTDQDARGLLAEACEIRAILARSLGTARERIRKSTIQQFNNSKNG